MANRLKKRVKKKWVAALRSGEYQQNRNGLRQDGKFCCLGVLCDIAAADLGVEWGDCRWKSGSFLNYTGYPPPEVLEWAGFTVSNDIDLVDEESIQPEFFVALAQINDNGNSFKNIADYIEAKG